MLLIGCCGGPDTVDITFDAAGGRFDDGETAFIMSVPSGSLITEADIPKPVRSGFDFSGWYLDDADTEIFDFSSPVSSDMTLYAGWDTIYRPVRYTVSFDLNLPDGIAEPVSSVVLAPGAKLETLADPVIIEKANKDYFTFLQWTDAEGTPYTTDSEIDSSITLYANWISKWDGSISAETVSDQLDSQVIKIRTA